MADLPTRLDLYQIGRDYILQRATKIDPNTVDTQGSEANLFAGSTSHVADQIVKQLGYRTAALFLDTADGTDLDRLAFDRYQLARKGASSALGFVDIFRATAAAGGGTVPAGEKLQSLTGVEYITTSDAVFGPADLTATANVRATQAGKATQVGLNAIRRFQNPQDLFDSTLQVNNPLRTAGGEDDEDDDTFRSRIRNFWKSARRGILAAIEFGALTVPGVVSAQASEALDPVGQAARIVLLYIADSSGVSNQALATQVIVALNDFRAAGIQVLVQTSLPVIVNITIAPLLFQKNVDTFTLTDLVRGALVEFVNSLPVNGTLYLSDLFSVMRRFVNQGVIVPSNAILLPSTDVVPAAGTTLRTTSGNILINGK